MSGPPTGAGTGPARSSVETLHAIAAGSTRTSPVAATFGQRLDCIASGEVGAHMPAHPTCGSGLGSALVLADLTLGAAISSTVVDTGVQTLRMQASTAGARASGAGPVHATSWLATTSEGTATSSGEVRTDDGRVIVTVSSRCALRPVSAAGGTEPPAAVADEGDVAPLDDAWHQLGLCATHAAPERMLPALAVLGNLSGVMQGGVIAAVLAHAAEDELQMSTEAASIDVDVAYLRGVPADGSGLPVVVEIVHRGRRYGLARATLLDREGRTAVTATVGAWVA